jgi:hypothetical protein
MGVKLQESNHVKVDGCDLGEDVARNVLKASLFMQTCYIGKKMWRRSSLLTLVLAFKFMYSL